MKRKKVMAITAIVFTCATMASCGKATETVNAEPVVQATEQIVLETEEIVQEATEKMEEENLQPTMVDGQLVYPDYPEEYIKYTPIDPVELWCIEHSTHYDNPNMTRGELANGGGFSQVGDKLTFDATCELDGVAYYKFIADDNRCYIVKAECWSETPPSEDVSSNTSTDNSENLTMEEMLKAISEREGIEYIGTGDGSWDDVPQELIDKAAGMVVE